eukprot:4796643-Pyramimonas_sp.AAC.1
MSEGEARRMFSVDLCLRKGTSIFFVAHQETCSVGSPLDRIWAGPGAGWAHFSGVPTRGGDHAVR